MRFRRRDGFTLLEILLAVVIGLLIITIAVPGIVGMMHEQELDKTFQAFDDFVHRVQARSVEERRTLRIVFEETGMTAIPADAEEPGNDEELEQFAFSDGDAYTIERPAALVKKPLAEWPFWRSGTCEPVRISYTGPRGSWVAEYNALTVRGTITDKDVK